MLTVEAWVNLEEIRDTWQSILIKMRLDVPGYADGYLLRLNQSNHLQMVVRNGGTTQEHECQVVYGSAFPVGDWHHVAGVFDGAQCHLFIDGILVASEDSSISTVGYHLDNLFLGDAHTMAGDALFGSIDEVRVSNVVRYTGNFDPEFEFEPDFATAGLWHFSEGEGVVTLDSSGNNNTGTLSKTDWTVRE
jgi:hypothetical protein